MIVRQLRISAEAESDMDQIAAYTMLTWGPGQADKYLTRLEEGLNLLAMNPLVGRPCDSLQSGLYRFEIERHVAFYFPEPEGVLIVRVLHHSMMPTRHL